MARGRWRRRRAAARAAPQPARRSRTPTATRRAGSSTCGARCRAAPRVRASPSCCVFPFVATPFFTFQVGGAVAGARADRAVADLPRRLRRHGVAGADDGGRHRRLRGGDPRHQQHAPRSASAGRGGWRCRSRSLIATAAPTLIGWLSVRTEGIYTIMITLAIGVAFYYLVLQNYSVFNGFQGLREVYPPTVFGIDWRDPLPFYFLALACALAGYFLVQLGRAHAVRHRAAGHPRQPAAHGRARLQRRRAPRRRVRAGRR